MTPVCCRSFAETWVSTQVNWINAVLVVCNFKSRLLQIRSCKLSVLEIPLYKKLTVVALKPIQNSGSWSCLKWYYMDWLEDRTISDLHRPCMMVYLVWYHFGHSSQWTLCLSVLSTFELYTNWGGVVHYKSPELVYLLLLLLLFVVFLFCFASLLFVCSFVCVFVCLFVFINNWRTLVKYC